MKTFIFLFVAALATFTVAELELNGELKEASDNCLASSGVDKEIVIRARKNDFVEDEKLMSYYTCVFQKMGMQSTDGNFKLDVMVENLPKNVNKENASKVLVKCIKTDATTPEKAAYDAVKCFISSMLTKA